jgi:hypothetical protein
MGIVADGLDRALERAFTRPIPKSAGAQMRYLVRQLKGTRPAAELLGISQRTVERYVKDQIRRRRADLTQRLADAVRARWQPPRARAGPPPGRDQQRPRHRDSRTLRLHRHAHGLMVEFTDIEALDFDL